MVKRTFIYLKGTLDYGIWYDVEFTLCTYTNANWVGYRDDRKSTSGEAFFLGGRLVSWLSKKQDCISQSTVEVEYVAVANNYNQVMWMN